MEATPDTAQAVELPTFERSQDDRMHYVQWYFLDFLEGIRGLKPDQIGIYSVVLPLIYASMGMLRDDDRYIAGHCKCDVRTYKKIKAQLIALGKISVRDGYVFNKRAIKEIARFCITAKSKRTAALEREAKKRGASTAGAQHAQDVRTPCANHAPSAHTLCSEKSETSNDNNAGLTTALPPPSTQKEIEIESPPLPPEGGEVCAVAVKAGTRARKRTTADNSFGLFWPKYPRKEAKARAQAAWQKLCAEDRAKAIAVLPVFCAKMLGKEEQYIPHAASWLNGRRFEDFSTDVAPAVVDDKEFSRQLAQRFVRTDDWDPGLGPKPGQPGSKVSADLLAEVRAGLARPTLVSIGGGHAHAA